MLPSSTLPAGSFEKLIQTCTGGQNITSRFIFEQEGYYEKPAHQ